MLMMQLELDKELKPKVTEKNEFEYRDITTLL